MTLPAPRAATSLLGHHAAQQVLLRAALGGKLHHAWLITGPTGIGKATLAFRFARFLLAGGADSPGLMPPDSLEIASTHPTFARIAASGHLDLLTVEREMDEKKDRLRGEITVDDARRIAPFLRMTAAEGGWRVVVVDGAEAMNRNAANAILKVLEEPPDRAVLLLVSHNPARLLPTIRSRCRTLALAPLDEPVLHSLLAQHDSSLDTPTIAALARLSEGSIGRAIGLHASDGIALYADLLSLLGDAPRLDLSRVHQLADRLGRASEEVAYRTFVDLLDWLLTRLVRATASGQVPPPVLQGEDQLLASLGRALPLERWMGLWETQKRLFAQTDAVYLDRKQAILSVFLALAAA